MASKSNQTGILVASATIFLTAAVVFLWKKNRETEKSKNHSSAPVKSTIKSDEKLSSDDDDDVADRVLNVPEDVVILNNPQEAGDDLPRIRTPNSITIVHGSVTGTAQKLALHLEASLQRVLPSSRKITRVTRMDEWDWWDELLNAEEDDRGGKKANNTNDGSTTPVLILLLPTYTQGTWPPCATTLQTALDEIQSDWRVAQFPLKRQLQVAVFGLGSSAYGDNTMGQPARQAMRAMQRLGAKLLVRLAVGDDSVGQKMTETFTAWSQQLEKALLGQTTNGSSKPKNTPKQISFEEDNDEVKAQNEVDDGDDDDEDEAQEPDVIDVEDMGDAVAAASSQQRTSSEPREMVTPSQAKALKKEGYQLIGTHSAVKLCRWTKHQLRGRGGCYKHTFYGITSYQCMEATPSLACANKVSF